MPATATPHLNALLFQLRRALAGDVLANRFPNVFAEENDGEGRAAAERRNERAAGRYMIALYLYSPTKLRVTASSTSQGARQTMGRSTRILCLADFSGDAINNNSKLEPFPPRDGSCTRHCTRIGRKLGPGEQLLSMRSLPHAPSPRSLVRLDTRR
jgi:hypothetical protein